MTHVLFSEDDKYLATADMSGIVQVWEVKTGTSVWTAETDDITVSSLISLAPLLFFFSFFG